VGRFLLVKPHSPLNSTSPRVMTPNPKEAIMIGTGGATINIDFGGPVGVDSAFLGYHTAPAGVVWSLAPTTSYQGADGAFLILNAPLTAAGLGPPYHGFSRAAAPVISRYWNLYLGAASQAFTLGVVVFGAAMTFTYNPEWGGGAFVEDTGTADRLKGGGFATDPGVATTGYQCTLGDLQDGERRNLYQLVKDRRTTRSLLLVEDDAQTDGLNERLHWGLLRKIEPFERLDPANTKFGITIGDWA
jgi:hypothetical protein